MTAGEPWPTGESAAVESAPGESAPGESAHANVATLGFATVDFDLAVNGTAQPVAGAWVGESLLFALRERLGLVAAKDGCGEGECGACTVLMDGQPTAACLVPAVAAVGRDVRTPEIYAVPKPDAVASALAAHAGTGCGFCLPGIGMELRALLARNPKPGASAIREALSGHRCRCLPAEKFVEAMRAVLAEPEARAPGPATLQTAVPDRPGRPAPPSQAQSSQAALPQTAPPQTAPPQTAPSQAAQPRSPQPRPPRPRSAPPQAPPPPGLDESGSWSWQSALGEAADRP